MPTPLDINGPALNTELDRLARDGAHLEAGVDTDGATAEVAYTWKNGWNLTAYAKAWWKGETAIKAGAGVRVKKTF